MGLAWIFGPTELFRLAAAETAASNSDPEKDPHVFAGIWENDLLYNPAPGEHQDRHYTQGLKLIFLDRGAPTPAWANWLRLDALADRLPTVGLDVRAANFGLTFGQNIYTPEDGRTVNLITNDRPYAGWLYLGAAVQRRGLTAGRIPTLESYELDVGLTGPAALGGWAQNTIHLWRHLPAFDGWGNQLRTEPVFDFKYGRAWKLSLNEESARFFDLIPNLGANLGTVQVSGNIGLTVRLGWNLPDDFGVQLIDSPIVLSNGPRRGPVGAFLFTGTQGRAIGRDMFLDGNLYQASAHVTKYPFVGDFMYGAAFTCGKHFEASWTFVIRSYQFVGQNGNDAFGSLTGKFKWDF